VATLRRAQWLSNMTSSKLVMGAVMNAFRRLEIKMREWQQLQNGGVLVVGDGRRSPEMTQARR
jgi:hypothetical protein